MSSYYLAGCFLQYDSLHDLDREQTYRLPFVLALVRSTGCYFLRGSLSKACDCIVAGAQEFLTDSMMFVKVKFCLHLVSLVCSSSVYVEDYVAGLF